VTTNVLTLVTAAASGLALGLVRLVRRANFAKRSD